MQPPRTLKPAFVLALLLATAHLALVLCGATRVRPFPRKSPPDQVLGVYGRWSGASSQYSFFAPTITPSLRVSFDVGLDSGEVVHDGLFFEDEAMRLRAYAMSLRFNGLRGDEQRASVARGWAAVMFGRYADSREVTIRVDRMRLPTMEDFRAGQRPTWTERYRAEFQFRPSSSQARASK